VLNAPLVSEIPRFDHAKSALPAADAAGPACTAFHGAALFIQSHHAESEIQRLAVVSAGRRQGRSTVAANVALALTASGMNILLVDADSLSGGASRLLRGRFESVPIRGLLPNAAAGLSFEDLVMPSVFRGRLALLTLNQTKPRLHQAEPESSLANLESDFNVVIIDSPPVSEIGPSLSVVRRAERALVVVTDNVPVASLQEAARLLNMIDLPVLGYVYTHPPRHRVAVVGTRRKAASDSENFDIEYRPIEVSAGPTYP